MKRTNYYQHAQLDSVLFLNFVGELINFNQQIQARVVESSNPSQVIAVINFVAKSKLIQLKSDLLKKCNDLESEKSTLLTGSKCDELQRIAEKANQSATRYVYLNEKVLTAQKEVCPRWSWSRNMSRSASSQNNICQSIF